MLQQIFITMDLCVKLLMVHTHTHLKFYLELISLSKSIFLPEQPEFWGKGGEMGLISKLTNNEHHTFLSTKTNSKNKFFKNISSSAQNVGLFCDFCLKRKSCCY